MNIIGITKQAVPFLLRGLSITVYLTIISGILAIGIGVIGGICRISKFSLIRRISSIYVNVFRGTPFLIQLYIAFYVFPSFGLRLSVFEAAIGMLALYNGAYITEIVRAGIEAIPKEQSEAAFSLGMTPYQTMKLIVFPQVMRIIIPPLVGQIILLVKNSSTASLIGVFDLIKVGRDLAIALRHNPIVIYSLVSFFYFIICYPLYLISIRIEKKLRAHHDSM